jgi:preprotein translocase subunit SecA
MINSVNYFDRSIVFSINISDHSDIVDIVWKAVVLNTNNQGRIQDIKLGGAHLKKLRRAEGGAKILGVFRVKIHDFTPKKQITESPSYP